MKYGGQVKQATQEMRRIARRIVDDENVIRAEVSRPDLLKSDERLMIRQIAALERIAFALETLAALKWSS